MVIEQRLGMLAMIGDTARDENGAQGRVGEPSRRGPPMPGPMLVAAAIAAGLVALWMALSLIVGG
jgi:hypothetical protein